MDSRHTIRLDDKLIARCWAYGQVVIDSYINNDNPRSAAFSRDGVDRNLRLQSLSRMAECAFCLWYHLDPIELLDWSKYCDPGFDVKIKRFRFDVKHTERGRCIIWPYPKNEYLDQAPIDVFVLVVGTPPSFTITGAVSKARFVERYKVAGGKHHLGFVEGTRYVDDYCDADVLLEWMIGEGL